MDLQTAINYVKQYRMNGKSCYIHSANRYNQTFVTNLGEISFACMKARYNHGGKSKWWRAYLSFADNGKPFPSKQFGNVKEINP